MNLKGRIKEVRVEPMAGDEIGQLKEKVKEFAKGFKCRINFCHNGNEFICDAEGNIAKIN